LASGNENVNGVMGMKRIKQQNFQTTRTKVGLVLNLGDEIKKSNTRT
jgi:hypothetical protein